MAGIIVRQAVVLDYLSISSKFCWIYL